MISTSLFAVKLLTYLQRYFAGLVTSNKFNGRVSSNITTESKASAGICAGCAEITCAGEIFAGGCKYKK